MRLLRLEARRVYSSLYNSPFILESFHDRDPVALDLGGSEDESFVVEIGRKKEKEVFFGENSRENQR
mgnify:CR=1 FL=1